MDHFRALGTFRKKMKAAIINQDQKRVKRLRRQKPKLDLGRVVAERYPSFSLALADLDDPLILLALVASLPSHRLFKISPATTKICQKLLAFFRAFICKKRLLRKVFLSAKGVYFQAEIEGKPVTWLEPYSFATTLPFDVDYKVILSFTEFYVVLLKFITNRLYKTQGWKFPPEYATETSPENTLGHVNIQQISATTEEPQMDEEFKREMAERSGKVQAKVDPELFEGLLFFISREVDKSIFELCVKSFGARVIYDEDNFESSAFRNPDITHVITDRPLNDAAILPGREYVQPQWVCDSINFSRRLPISDYKPGKALPPHLSPFVDDKAEGHVPERKKQIQAFLGEFVEEDVEDDDAGEHEKDVIDVTPVDREQPVIAVADEKLGPKYEKKKVHGSFKAKEVPKIEYKARRNVADPEAEAQMARASERNLEKEKFQLQTMALNRKKRRLLDKILYSNQKQDEYSQNLKSRERELKGAKLSQ